MNERINQCYYLFLVVAITFFSWGLLELNKANCYQPKLPGVTPAKHYSFAREAKVFPLTRYQNLLSGDLFFGKALPPPMLPSSQVKFQTELLVIGIAKGSTAQDGYAVVGLKKTGDRVTWIVQAGQVIKGERVVSIHDGYIMVGNQTGVGKVPLRD